MRKILLSVIVSLCLMCSLSGCAQLDSNIQDLKGSIKGNTYIASFYSNSGELFMTASGKNIDIDSNIVKEMNYSSEGGWGYSKTLSSVITITIDGSQVESCGSTVIFAEDGLTPDVDYIQKNIESQAEGLGDLTMVASVVNKYKNSFGKPTVVVIQSQLGDPICAYSGNKIYWEVCQDIPKTTKLSIDGKALYIHRANFQIIDKDLLD